jgi:hypothetical protein
VLRAVAVEILLYMNHKTSQFSALVQFLPLNFTHFVYTSKKAKGQSEACDAIQNASDGLGRYIKKPINKKKIYLIEGDDNIIFTHIDGK